MQVKQRLQLLAFLVEPFIQEAGALKNKIKEGQVNIERGEESVYLCLCLGRKRK
jgi:hypothetical protein